MGRVNFLTNCKSALKGSVKKWKFKMALAMRGGGSHVPLRHFDEEKIL